MSLLHRLLLFAVALAIPLQQATAQPLWIDRTPDRVVSLEFLKGSYEGESEESFFTAMWFLSTRLATGDVFAIVAEVPFVNYSDDFGEGSKTLGNIYLGAEIHNSEANVFGEFGVRVPAADDSEFATFLGGITEFVDRADAFAIDAVPITGAFNYYRQDPTGLVSRVRVGPTVWIPTGDREDVESMMVYSGQVGYQSEVATILAGLSGRWLWSAEGTEGIGENTFHQFGVAVGVVLGIARPAFTLRAPLDEDLNDFLNFIWGVSLTVNLSG